MKIKMQFFAFGEKCGAFAASGLTDAGAADSAPKAMSLSKSDAVASNPMPFAVDVKNSRLVCWIACCSGFINEKKRSKTGVLTDGAKECQSRVINSSVLSTIRATEVHAARSTFDANFCAS